MTALATLSLGAFPLTAQLPVPPTPPAPPARVAGPPAPLTEEQRQQHLAIREKYAKEIQAQREAIQSLNAKMRAEIEATLTPEQRQARQQGGGRGLGQGVGRGLGQGQGVGRGMGLGQQGGGRGLGQGQGGGRMGAMAPGNGQLRQRARLYNRADRAAQQVIMMRDRLAVRAMRQQRGMGQMVRPGMMGGRGGGMIGQGNMTGGPPAPKVVKPAPSKAPPAPPAPAKKPPASGGGG